MDDLSKAILMSWRKILKSNIKEHGRVDRSICNMIRRDYEAHDIEHLFRDDLTAELASIRSEFAERRGVMKRVRLIVDGKDRYKNPFTRRTGEYKAAWLRSRGHRVELKEA